MVKKVLRFFKTNFIFTTAILMAIVSCFFVPIDKKYLGILMLTPLLV